MCGAARDNLPTAPLDAHSYPRDEGQIARRKLELQEQQMGRHYVRQYSAQAARLRDFLAAGVPPKHITFSTPADLVDFAISREPFARTRYHVDACIMAGQETMGGNCACPRRMPPTSFQTLMGQLSSFLMRHGCSGEWNDETQSGNPTASTLVRDHRKALMREAAKNGSSPQKAVVFFSDKVVRVVMYMLRFAQAAPEKSVDRLIRYMDIALLLALFASGRRGQDLANIPTQGCSFAPNGTGIFLRSQLSKTNLRAEVQWIFAPACPSRRYLNVVWGMQGYLREVARMQLPGHGPLFRNHRLAAGKDASALSPNAIEPSVFNRRIQGYLTAIGLFQGESVHGLRHGRPIEMAIREGDAEAAFGDKVWATPSIQKEYMELVDVMVACYRHQETPDTWEAHEQRLAQFRQLNEQGKLASALEVMRTAVAPPPS